MQWQWLAVAVHKNHINATTKIVWVIKRNNDAHCPRDDKTLYLHHNYVIVIGDAESAFFACFGIQWENETPDDSIILWDTVRLNIGGHYDIATGTYITPVDGIYQFQVQVGKIKFVKIEERYFQY